MAALTRLRSEAPGKPETPRRGNKEEREWAALKAPPWFGGGMVRWEAKAEMF